MIKKTFIILLTGLSILSYAQEPTGAESTAADKPKKEKKEKVKKEKPAKAPKPAKEPREVGEFKPQAGDISIDFTANDLFKIGQISNQFELSDGAQGFGGGIRARYFLSPEGAVRVNFVTDIKNFEGFPVLRDPLGALEAEDSEGGKVTADAMDGANGSHRQRYSHFSISLGYEYHFEGTDRLDTYAGGELLYDKVTVTEKFNNVDVNGNYAEGYIAKASGGTVGNSDVDLSDKSDVWNAAGTGIGLRVMAGADFYVFPKIYIGAELGVALMQKYIEDYKFEEYSVTGHNSVIEVTDRGKTFNVGQDVTGQFRIGFRL